MGTCGQVQSPNDVIQTEKIGKTMNNTHIKATEPTMVSTTPRNTPAPSSKPRPTSTAPLLSPLFLQLLRYTIALCQPNSSKAALLMIICRLHKTKTFQATSTPWKPHFFHLDSSERGVKQRCCFGEQIPWFRVDRRPICVRVNAVSSFCGLSVKEVTDELCALQWCLWNKMN